MVGKSTSSKNVRSNQLLVFTANTLVDEGLGACVDRFVFAGQTRLKIGIDNNSGRMQCQ